MSHYDERLQQLQTQVARWRQLNAKVQELRTQQAGLSRRVNELDQIRVKEQTDVDRLEGGSLAQFFFKVVGKLDERLDRERQEAYAASVKYDAAAKELAEVTEYLRRCEDELAGLANCEAQYRQALEEKSAALKASGTPGGAEILRLEEHLAYLSSQHRELGEAAAAGASALSTTDQILSSLDSAEGWGTWDLLGGGLISDLAKHSHLDEAQENIELLQSQLRRFKTELADVTIQADLQVGIDGFLRFADYFFDGLFADWAVLDHIHNSQEQIRETRYQISAVLHQLKRMREAVEAEQAETQAKLDTLVVNTAL